MTTLPRSSTRPTREFRCPFCGGYASVLRDPPSVAHSIPVCRDFKRDAAEFLLEVRRREGN